MVQFKSTYTGGDHPDLQVRSKRKKRFMTDAQTKAHSDDRLDSSMKEFNRILLTYTAVIAVVGAVVGAAVTYMVVKK